MKAAFNYTIGKQIKFILHDLKPVKKTKHENTEYYFFDATVLEHNNQQILMGKHTVQLPIKRVVLPMYQYIQQLNSPKSEHTIEIIKESNYHFKVIVYD
jgi:hypothetical protein